VAELTGDGDPAHVTVDGCGAPLFSCTPAVDDPLGLKATEPGLPLLLNSYVDVTIEGKQVEAVGEVPRIAMRGDDELWVMENGKLEVKPVEVVWRKRTTVLIRGLPTGAQVITSPVPAAVDGMAVRPAASAPSETAKGDAAP
jgi:hypothetical protein